MKTPLQVRMIALENILPRARFRVRGPSTQRSSVDNIKHCGRRVRIITTEEIKGEIHVVDGADVLREARFAGCKEILTADISLHSDPEKLAVRLHLAWDYPYFRSGAVQ